jgi:hypothetical protein
MAKNQTRSSDQRLTHPILEELGAAAGERLFAYSVKVVCGKQTETNCCCVAGARSGVYATDLHTPQVAVDPVVKKCSGVRQKLPAKVAGQEVERRSLR